MVSNFYGTKIEIWAGFGPVGRTEKKIEDVYRQLLRAVFSCHKFFLEFFEKYFSVRIKKLHKMKVKKN